MFNYMISAPATRKVLVVSPIRRLALIVLVVGVALSYPGTLRADADGALMIELPNGIRATVYPAEYLENYTTYDGTRGSINVRATGNFTRFQRIKSSRSCGRSSIR
jgi:hypothetical protein